MYLSYGPDGLRFRVDQGQISEPEVLVGTLATRWATPSERLTDLTTVYLGFGILTTNNAYRYHSSLESFAFGLALQILLRGAEERPVLKQLQPNPKSWWPFG
jgi:hypothetical protein